MFLGRRQFLFLFFWAAPYVLSQKSFCFPSNTGDARHEKTDLKIFVLGPANPSLGMKPTIKDYSTAFIHYIL